MQFDSHTGYKIGAAPLTAWAALLLSFAVLLGPPFVSRAIASAITEAQAAQLAPGSYLWDPSVAPSGPITMVVKLDSQRAFVWRNGKLIGISVIASGKPGYETPDGVFTVLEKQKDHHSNKYDDAPMPYMQRLTEDGIAVHGGHARGYPASHGCIRLPMGFAAALFKENNRGMHVVIRGRAPSESQTTVASQQHAPQQPNDWQAVEYSNNQSNEPSAVTDQPGNGEAADQADSGTGNNNVNRFPDQGDETSYDYERREQNRAQSRENPARDLRPPPQN